MVVEACRSVKLACAESIHPTLLPLFAVVQVGMQVTRFCRVSFASPNPCILHPMSSVSVVDLTDVVVKELEHNVVVTVRHYDKKLDIVHEQSFVYPKAVWSKVLSVVAPLREGRAPRNPGAIFIGPPGTGKSSMISVIADWLGLTRIEVSPDMILSKWVGESEKRFSALFEAAESAEPATMLFDEAEWIIVRPAERSSGTAEVTTNLTNKLKMKLAEYYKFKRQILLLFAANVTEQEIDSALKREGRCGKPILIPLPDFEAVYSYLVLRGIPEKEAEKIAIEAVNAGLSMADVEQVANSYLETCTYRIEPMRYRGYRRYVAPAKLLSNEHVKRFLEEAEKAYSFTQIASYKRSRVFVTGAGASILVPIVAAIVGLVARKPVVVVDNELYITEALEMISLLEAVAIVNHAALRPDTVKLMWLTSDFPIIFVGQAELPTGVEAHTIRLRDLIARHREAAAMILLQSYGIQLEKQQLDKLFNRIRVLDEPQLLEELQSLVLSGRVRI
jgi:CBS domain-containing protein